MSHWEHSRFKIFNPGQHPLKHDVSDFAYSNARIPGVTLLTDALDYIVAVLYPNYIGTFATTALLPVSAGQNDYAIVTDDGDGRSAGYVYASIDGASGWIKRYDVDWSLEGIFAESINRTQWMYVHKHGFDDRDASGAVISGAFAGQTIYGGATSGTNLTLRANSGDLAGVHSGVVQVDDDFAPAAHDAYNLGSSAKRFKNGFFQSSVVTGTLTIGPAAISDSSGGISFGTTNLSTSGTITTGVLTATTGVSVGTLSLASGSIEDSSGVISFGSNHVGTGGVVSAIGASFGSMSIQSGAIWDMSGAISFGFANLSTSGTLTSGDITTTRVLCDNLSLDGNTISVLNANGNLIFQANGTGLVDIQSPLQTLGQTVSGTVSITGQLNIDSIRLDNTIISTTALNADLTLSPNGTGNILSTASVLPSTTGVKDIGSSALQWSTLWLSGGISNSTHTITATDLMTLRSVPYRDSARTQGAQVGDQLLWSGSEWLAAAVNTSLDHSGLTGVTTGDAGHTQFVMLQGRAGGQVVQGGTAASEGLTLESTAHASKGSVFTKDNFVPFTNASFSGGWSGTDLGDSGHYFRDVYTRGVFKNFRLETYTSATLPSASGQNVGRAVFNSDVGKILVDTGGTWTVPGGSTAKFSQDTVWNGSATQLDVTVSAVIGDARNAIWQLCDNANDFERIFCSLKAISASQVRITVNPALPAGSYRLIGIE